MNALKLSDLIGQEIVEIRYHFKREDYGLQEFHCFLKLTNDHIIDIPIIDDNNYLEINDKNIEYLKEMFDSGQLISEQSPAAYHAIGQKIEDFLFKYHEGELDFRDPCYIKLSNNYYITEIHCRPTGILIDLFIFDDEQFEEEVKRLKSINVEVISFKES